MAHRLEAAAAENSKERRALSERVRAAEARAEEAVATWDELKQARRDAQEAEKRSRKDAEEASRQLQRYRNKYTLLELEVRREFEEHCAQFEARMREAVDEAKRRERLRADAAEAEAKARVLQMSRAYAADAKAYREMEHRKYAAAVALTQEEMRVDRKEKEKAETRQVEKETSLTGRRLSFTPRGETFPGVHDPAKDGAPLSRPTAEKVEAKSADDGASQDEAKSDPHVHIMLGQLRGFMQEIKEARQQ